MNKFVKKNIVLVGVMVISGVAAVGLLIAAAVVWISLLGSINETKETRDKVVKLTRAKPAPGAENVKRIQHDIELYKKITDSFKTDFVSPMQPALEAFIAELGAPRVERLSEEEYERFRYVDPKENEMSDEDREKLPKRTRKLTLDEFKNFYRECFEREYGDDPRKDSLATQETFIDGFSGRFPNWSKALAKFVEKAKELTVEPIVNTNDEAVLLTAMGFPRAIPNVMVFGRHMENYRVIIARQAEKSKIEVMPPVLRFMVGGSTSSTSSNSSEQGSVFSGNFAPADMREIFFQWDVLGDIIGRLGAAQVKIFHNIVARDFAETREEGRLLGNYSETVGAFKLYHYTIEITGNMQQIREFCKQLDEGYKKDRTYIVRAVTLYAEENGAAILMGQKISSSSDSKSDSQSTVIRGRRRRRAVENNEGENSGENEEQLRLQEEARIKAMPVEKRPGYGRILIGSGDFFRAMIDVDYVVRDQNQ